MSMNFSEALLKAAPKMEPLLKIDNENWYLRFQFVDGKAAVYFIAKDPSQCGSGYFGDAAHIRHLTRKQTRSGNPLLDENNLTAKGKLLLQANGDQQHYEKLVLQYLGIQEKIE